MRPISKQVKSILRPVWHLYLKYFSEVGYITRQVNRLESRFYSFPEWKRRRFLAEQIKSLSKAHEEIVHQLNMNGYCKTTLSELGISADILVYLSSLSKSYEAIDFNIVKETNVHKAKYYWLKMNRDQNADRVLIDAFVRNKSFLDLISSYCGEVPHFNGFEYMYSPPLPVGQELRGSQNWHLDNHHKKVLKCFFSPFPLTTSEGATQIFPSRLSTSEYYTAYPNYMTDEEISKAGVSLNDQIHLTGESGTIYLVDTARCLHCGSRNILPRHLAIVTFTSTERYLSRWGVKKESDLVADINKEIMEAYEPDSAIST
jgi:hypothetical protein